jgi:hypothetical protein
MLPMPTIQEVRMVFYCYCTPTRVLWNNHLRVTQQRSILLTYSFFLFFPAIDRNEFIHIMGIACAQILGRMMVYYLILILLVPMVAAFAVHQLAETLPILETVYGERAAEQAIGMTLFFFVIPILWNTIDQYSQQGLLLHRHDPTTSTTTMTMTTTSSSTTESSKEE